MTMTFRKTGTALSAIALAAMIGAAGMSPGATTAAPYQPGGYVELVERVAPAVVTIEVEQKAQLMSDAQGAMPRDFPFEEFYKRFGLPAPEFDHGPRGEMPVRKGAGTGFIISENGQIVTNAHVVHGADTVRVTLEDGRSYEAEVVGEDTATDLAVLKIEAQGLTAVAFGDSDALKVGENVVAMGNPFGLGNTVTTGIVSAVGRDINAGLFDNFIQTDAAINRGNSGGPLFNEAGEVVGINTAIVSPSGGSVGIGFSVPANMAKAVVEDLTDDGQVARGWLGVQIQPVSEDVATALGLEAAQGAMIARVVEDTPAQKAGLEKGDIVLAVGDAPVESPRDLTRLIAGDSPGDTVMLKVLRKGQAQELSVTLGSRADQPA
ncbi:S1C family serine protease [Marimonas lutisalis]|uniref:S1C family serine protease n=1 Tax=Marimonas lutisalis TaxID=2545756 RepID=UPI0010F4A70A|nr:Do family serine endopeptidase [Marimonas lutisalis]